MNDYNDVKMKISKLESMISKGVFSTNNPNWKLVWQQIKIVGSNFKGINFPTKEEHQQSWDKFQDIVNEVKCRQKEEQHKWDQKKAESIKLRDSIIAQAHRAELPSGIGNLILAIATMGISEILNTIMGPFDEKKRELQSAGVELKKGWPLPPRPNKKVRNKIGGGGRNERGLHATKRQKSRAAAGVMV